MDLSALDFKTLSLFYMPIIGVESYALYHLLLQLLNKTNKDRFEVVFLIDLLNIKIATFNEAREKLEAINLIETYKQEDGYIIYLKSPFTAKQFVTDTVLGSYLQSEIGDKSMSLLLELFKSNHHEKLGKNISKQFDDLYVFTDTKLIPIDYELQGRSEQKKMNVTYAFNYETFVEGLPNRLKSENLLNPNFKEQLIKLAYVYHLKEEDLIVIYEKAPRKTIQSLNLQAKLYFESKSKQIVVKPKEIDLYTQLRNATINELLAGRVDENYEGLARKTYFEITQKYESLDLGMIHVLIVNLLKIKDGILPNTRYLEMVLNDWIAKGIDTAEQAINHINGLENKYKSSSNYKVKTKQAVKTPDWMDEYLEEIRKMDDQS